MIAQNMTQQTLHIYDGDASQHGAKVVVLKPGERGEVPRLIPGLKAIRKSKARS